MKAGTAQQGRTPQDGDAEARPLRRAAAWVLLFNGVLVAWVILKPGSDRVLAAVVNSAEFVGPLLALPLCFGGLLRRIRRRGDSQTDAESASTMGQRWAPVLLGLGITCWILGQMLFTYYEWVLRRPPPLPSLADIGYLSVYPFLLLGILLLPARPVPVASRTRIALDGLMIMTAAVTFSWYFVLGPIMQQGTETTLAKAVSAAYPLADIVLIACLVILASRPEEQTLLPAVRLLALGLILIVVADSNFAYWSLHGAYATGTLPDAGWSLGYMLVALGAFAARLASTRDETDISPGPESPPTEQRVWTSLLPFVFIPAVGILVVYAWRTSAGNYSLALGVYLGGAVLIGLVLLRQAFIIVENARLYNRLQRTYRQVEQKNDQLVRSQGELRRQKEYFEALVLNSPVAIAIIDLEGNVASWNPAAERLFGYTQAQAVGRNVDDLVAGTPEMHAEVLKYTQQVSSDGRVDTVTRRSRKDGTLVDVELLAVPVTVGGERVGTYAMYHDISELKQAEQELQESQRRFMQLFDQSVDALILHDSTGRMVDCNQEACRSLGYSREEMLSLYIMDIETNLISSEDTKRAMDPTLWQRALAGEPGTLAGVHYGEHRRKDGTTFPVEVHVGSVDYGGRRMILASIRDITERKRIEEEVSQLNKDLENQVAERTEQLKSAMARQQEEAQERHRIEQELRVARLIQQTLLPRSAPEVRGYQIAAYYQPAREIGGDFYDFFELEDGRLGIVVGDASGKGIPAALVMASTRSVLRTVAQREGVAPGEALAEANEILYPDIPPNTFVTCFYAILDPESGRFLYANAGHDLPYLCREGSADELRATGMPLGLMPGMSYEEKEIVLQAGDTALLYSDGLVEAHDPEGEMFGFPRLRALIAEHGEESSLGDFLLEEFYAFTEGEREQEDDITLLTLRCSAPLG